MTALHLYHPTEGQQVVGQADGDVLQGGTTNDWLIGHAGGQDVFAFEKGGGADIVLGFEHGVDVLQVHGSIRQTSMRDTDAGMEVFFGTFGQSGPDHFLVAGVHGLALSDFAFV
jgi:Ca2+-binding RTX toxin-like protein